jgi:lysyl-tRNA synthetase, class II
MTDVPLRRSRPARTRQLAALATALAGIATLASSLSPNAPARDRLLEAFEPSTAQAVAHVLGAAGGLVTLWLALGVLQGRRSTGRAAIVVLGVLAVVHAAKGLDYEEALLGLAVALALHRVLGREDRSSRALIGALMALVALAGAYAFSLTVMLVSGHSLELATAMLRAGEAVVLAVPAGLSAPARTGLHVLIGVAGASVVLVLRALLAPALPRDGHDEAEHRRVAALVAAFGEDSIAPFALRADKAFHFAHGGALAYRALRETAVVAGDPIGPPGSAGPIMASFLEFAYGQGWDVVLVAAKEENLGDYAALGLRTMQVGLEGVVDPRTWCASKTVRKAVARVARRGWTIELVRGAELDARATGELMAVEAAWRRTHRRLYGFAMASDRLWGAPEDADDVYAIARNPAGEVRAFQRYVRYRRGFSLDAMRRLDDDPNGIADSLVAAALAHAREQDCSEVSLNFSGFAHVMAVDTVGRRSHRLARWALRRLHGRFQLERLARFTHKFGPAWRPRYLIYTARTRLPLAALRVLQAEAYIRPPRPRLSPNAWLPAPAPLPQGRLLTSGR